MTTLTYLPDSMLTGPVADAHWCASALATDILLKNDNPTREQWEATLSAALGTKVRAFKEDENEVIFCARKTPGWKDWHYTLRIDSPTDVRIGLNHREKYVSESLCWVESERFVSHLRSLLASL